MALYRRSQKGAAYLTKPPEISSKSNTGKYLIVKKYLSCESNSSGITLTFEEKFRGDYMDPLDMHMYVSQLIRRSNIFKQLDHYILIPEFDKNSHLHYHGILFGYKVHIIKVCQWWRKKFGWVKPEYRLRFPYCISNKVCSKSCQVAKQAKLCWLHYMYKDIMITGLTSITSINGT